MELAAQTHRDVVEALGLGPDSRRSELALVSLLERGLPVSALDRLCKRIAPADASFKYKLVSKATLSRRRSAKKRSARQLSPEESARLARTARVWTIASNVWGDDDAARQFLLRAHPLLEQRSPLEVAMSTDLGARLVEDILGRLQHGSAP